MNNTVVYVVLYKRYGSSKIQQIFSTREAAEKSVRSYSRDSGELAIEAWGVT